MADGDDLEDEKRQIEPINDENMEINDTNDDEDNFSDSDLDSIVDECAREYTDLDKTLNKLDVCLDTLETRSNDLYSKFKELLDSSRLARKELQEERQQTSVEHQTQDKP